ncbi:hypothetical protein Bpfe_015242, partial [Biomphalaria pfeifferi]
MKEAVTKALNAFSKEIKLVFNGTSILAVVIFSPHKEKSPSWIRQRKELIYEPWVDIDEA